ncbi:MAG: class I SAM-dependent methyltransferase [Oscillatoriophycideae cyanobacterium NC_groundwater_1537_Pr4_S-0.65um_50_18]|nr:class I SAM-dependent methyltransferase [Oscillatoriophycideae cyanobacterium NC_groundwater_1537_Pr4_S-0.65um_50_18]
MSLETLSIKAQSIEKSASMPRTLWLCGTLQVAVLAILWSLGLPQPELILSALLSMLVILAIAIQLESYYRTQSNVANLLQLTHRLIHRQDEQITRQQDEQILALLQQNSAQRRQDYRQIESLFSVFALLKLSHPLPSMREWAISPDMAALIIALVHERKPKRVVEVSSGISTLMVAYCLQQIGEGSVVSLEHEAQFADASREQVGRHGLQNIAKVIHAPLVPVTIADQTWQWYDIAPHQAILHPIDLLIIDGPPGDLQHQSRYPALPQLFDALSADAMVVLDDGDRADEQAIVARWQQEFPGIQVQRIANEKGAFVLHVRKVS